jgi:hypothetical protein
VDDLLESGRTIDVHTTPQVTSSTTWVGCQVEIRGNDPDSQRRRAQRLVLRRALAKFLCRQPRRFGDQLRAARLRLLDRRSVWTCTRMASVGGSNSQPLTRILPSEIRVPLRPKPICSAGALQLNPVLPERRRPTDGKFAAWQQQGLRTVEASSPGEPSGNSASLGACLSPPKRSIELVCLLSLWGSKSNSSHRQGGIAKPGNEASVRNFPASRE